MTYQHYNTTAFDIKEKQTGFISTIFLGLFLLLEIILPKQ